MNYDLSAFRTGDIVAFNGTGPFSAAIRWKTRSPVTHVAMVLETYLKDPGMPIEYDEYSPRWLQLGEAMEGGVKLNDAKARMSDPDWTDIWHLSLHYGLDFNAQCLIEFAAETLGRPYDVRQAILSAFDRFTESKRDYRRFFCSEWCAAALQAIGVVPQSVNASEATPIDVCRWRIFERCVQLKGTETIPGFNTVWPPGE